MPDQEDVRGGHSVGDRPPGRNGSSPEERTELPVDLAVVKADDELIDTLDHGVPVSDTELARVLLAWRQDIRRDDDGEPFVDVDTALAVVASARRLMPRRRPVLMPVAAVAAVVVVAFSGLGLGARFAEPGDTLWPLTEVLYSERAERVCAELAEQPRESVCPR